VIRARLLRIDEAPCNLEGDTWTKVAPDDHNLLWLDLEDASDEEIILVVVGRGRGLSSVADVAAIRAAVAALFNARGRPCLL
jgi:hypothetical protein